MKKTGMVFFLILILSSAVHADLTLIQPLGGETIPWLSQYKIKWHAPAQEGYQAVTIFLENANDATWIKIVDDTHIKSDGEHDWHVGKLKDGTFAPPGIYRISLESDDGDAFGHAFAIRGPSIDQKIVDHFKQIRKIKIIYDPGACHICFRLNLKEAKVLLPKVKESYSIHLYKGEKIVAKLGRHGGKNILDDLIPIKVNPRDANVLKSEGGDTYNLHLLNQAGKTISTSQVYLELAKFRTDTRKIPKLKPTE